MRHLHLFLLGLLMLSACKPSRPSYVISEKKMEDIMVDYHLAQGIADVQGGNREVQTYKNVQAVFRKYNVTEERFDSSLIYYSTYSEKMSEIYKRVALRVETMASLMGVDAQQPSQDRYADLTSEGDTANIWSDQPFVILQPNKLQNMFSFFIPADSTFHLGDSFLWRFNTNFRIQNQKGDVYSILLIRYETEEEDTVANGMVTLSDSKLYEIDYTPDMRLDSLRIKNISGYIFWSLPDKKNAGDFSLLIVKDISLIRFHKQESKSEETDVLQLDSLETDSISEDVQPVAPVRLSPTERRDQQPREQKQRIKKESPIDPNLLNPAPRRQQPNQRK